MRTITIEVSRTVQIQSYEPVSVRVSETIKLDDDEDEAEARADLYKAVTKQVASYIKNEQLKYSATKK